MKTFVIGDIHGHYDQLMRLYKKLTDEASLDSKKDRLVFLGDYVDGGPKTKQVLTQLVKWFKKYSHWVFLFGNHEDLMLDALIGQRKKYGDYYLWWNQGGKATADSYKPKRVSAYQKAIMQPLDYIPIEHLDWLTKLPYCFEDENCFYVHAGVFPDLDLKNHDFNDPDIKMNMIWIRDQFIDSPYKWEKKIIYGHTASKEPLVMDNKIGIDTMFHNLGKLTALELPAEKFYFESVSTSDMM